MTDPVQPNIELLRDVRRLRIGGSDQVIGARAFDVLAFLHSNASRVVTKAELLSGPALDDFTRKDRLRRGTIPYFGRNDKSL